MTYVDTSTLLKLFCGRIERELAHNGMHGLGDIHLSSIAYMECHVQLKARLLGGLCNFRHYQAQTSQLDQMKTAKPFFYRTVPGAVFERGVQQARDPAGVYLRSMDCLHLAAMEELGAGRLLTNDLRQAEAARKMGFGVTVPGADGPAGGFCC